MCIPKKRNITKLSSIICWIDDNESSKDAAFVDEKDEDDHSLVELTDNDGDGDELELCGMSGCAVLS